MTGSETQGHLEEIYGVEVSPELISTDADGVIEEPPPGMVGRCSDYFLFLSGPGIEVSGKLLTVT
jgi:hypothetical protein